MMKYYVYQTKEKKYAVKKEGSKRALKVFDNKIDALIYAQGLANKNNGQVVDQTLVKEISKKLKKTKHPFLVVLVIILVICLLGGFTYYGYKKGFINLDFLARGSNNHQYENVTSGVVYDDFQIHIMQLGNNKNGDAIYIKAGEKNILIDAGTSKIDQLQNYINTCNLDENKNPIKVDKFDYVIVTHSDLDHIEGFISSNSMFDRYKIDTIIDFKTEKAEVNDKGNKTKYGSYVESRKRAEVKGSKHYYASDLFQDEEKRVFTLKENLTMEIMYNKYYTETSNDENNYSVVTMFNYNNHKFLFTGDLEKDGEEAFANYYKNTLGQVDFYKAGHHGSKTSSNKVLLDLIKPKICAVSCSAGNSEYTPNYKNVFPTQIFVNNIAQYTDNVYVTSMGMDDEEKPINGNIIVSCNGEDVSVASTGKESDNQDTSNGPIKLKDSLWFNKEIYVVDTGKKDSENGGNIYNFVSAAKKKDYYNESTPNAIKVPFRVWPN